jgi:hypothetical protein
MRLQATMFFKKNTVRAFSLLPGPHRYTHRTVHVNLTTCLRAMTVSLVCDRPSARAHCNTKKKSPKSKNIQDLASRAKISNYIMPPL